LSAVALGFSVSAANAAEMVVTPGGSWTNIPTTGLIAITSTQARNGNGSLELTGDRGRFAMAFDTPFTLSTVESLTFDWRIAGDSIAALNPDYTPALRLIVNDGSAVREMIWEGAYNGVYGSQTVPDTWYTTGAADKFYVGSGNENAGVSLATWASNNPTWTVLGISVGHGSSAGAGYHAFADNVTLTLKNGASTTYNFETAVPEPASWMMMIAGFALTGRTRRRRALTVRFALPSTPHK